MRLTLVLAAATMLIGIRAGHAYEGSWCAHETVGAGFIYVTCGIPSFEQCNRLVTTGNGGYCTRDLRWSGYYEVEEPRRYRHRKYRRYR